MKHVFYPEITVWLPEPNVINGVASALRRHPSAGRLVAETFRSEALHCRDYAELVALLKRWVTVV